MKKKAIFMLFLVLVMGSIIVEKVNAAEIDNTTYEKAAELNIEQPMPRALVCTCGGTFNSRNTYTS